MASEHLSHRRAEERCNATPLSNLAHVWTLVRNSPSPLPKHSPPSGQPSAHHLVEELRPGGAKGRRDAPDVLPRAPAPLREAGLEEGQGGEAGPLGLASAREARMSKAGAP